MHSIPGENGCKKHRVVLASSDHVPRERLSNALACFQVDEKRKDEMFLRLRIRYVQLLDTLDELSDVFGLQLFVWLSLMFFHTCVKVFLYAKYKVMSNGSIAGSLCGTV